MQRCIYAKTNIRMRWPLWSFGPLILCNNRAAPLFITTRLNPKPRTYGVRKRVTREYKPSAEPTRGVGRSNHGNPSPRRPAPPVRRVFPQNWTPRT